MSRLTTRGTPRHDNRLERRVFEAVRRGNINTVSALMTEHGPQRILSMEMPGETILQAAVENDQEEMLKFLVEECGAADQINQLLWNGDTLLHRAVKGGQRLEGLVRLLLQCGANPDIPDRDQRCALDTAFENDNPSAAQILITYGDDPVRTAQLAGRYLRVAEQLGMDDMAATLSDLLEDFDRDDPEFGLYNAIINNDQRRFKQLFFQRADPFTVRFGQTKMSALHAAARQRDIQMLATLLARVDRMGRVDAVDKNGQTPLHYAASRNNKQHVDWLLFVGADPDKKDKDQKTPEDFTTSRKVLDLFTFCWDSVPDAIVLMSGDSWCEMLPRTMCTLSRSAEQPSDSTLPPVLAFRCTTDDAYEDEMDEFEVSTFMTEETWVEVFEYRCSKPWVMRVAVDVTLYGYDPNHSSFFFVCTDVRGQTEQTVNLQVAEDGEGSCDVEVLNSGKLVLVHRRQHLVATAVVGPDQCVIRPDHLQGFKLEVPCDAFAEDQEIMIRSEDPQLQPHQGEPDIMATGRQPVSEPQDDDTETFFEPIKNISCFYTIVNGNNERPQKSLHMTIPIKTTPGSRIVTLTKNQKQANERGEDEAREDDGQMGAAEVGAVAAALSSPDPPVSRQPVTPSDAGIQGAESGWRVTDVGSVESDQAVSTVLPDMGLCVVAAEVGQGMDDAEIVQAVQRLYERVNKNEILIFAMAKPSLRDRVEVMVCCASANIYEATEARLKGDGYSRLKEPIVAYAVNREIFSLQLKGNLLDAYMDSEPVLEYQVGGRLNHTTFVLQLDNEGEPAEGAVVVKRKRGCNNRHPLVGTVHLELTQFFQRDFMFSRGGRWSKVDELVLALSEGLNTDDMRVYCYALGLTKDLMKEVCRSRPGASLSPTEKNFRMLSETRSRFRSESAFCSHLKEVLERHKHKEALKLLNRILNTGSS